MAVGAAGDVRERLVYDTPLWVRHCATILGEDRRPVQPVEPRPWQLVFDAALERQRAAGLPMRAVVLKARKLGFSTWVQLKFLQRITQLPFQYAIVASQKQSTSSILMDMARLCYRRLPSEEQLGLGFSIKPMIVGESMTRASTPWMALGDRLRPEEASIYETVTAGGRTSGRGGTPNMIHGSEVAWYEDPGFMIGLLNSIPDLAETIVVQESTANGFNHFHGTWERAVAGGEDPETGGFYAALFFGWQDNPVYSRAFSSDRAREDFERTVGDEDGGGDGEEFDLLEQGVGLEQLFWRRTTISEKCEGKLDLFHQEYPATAEQAFVGSGTPVFPGILIGRAIRSAEAESLAQAPVEGVLRPAEVVVRRTRHGTIDVPARVVWVPPGAVNDGDRERWGSAHRLLVWEHPVNEFTQDGVPEAERRPAGQYIVFGDVAAGEGATVEDGDHNVIQVVDHVSLMQVARYRSRVPIHDMPLLLVLVATYYNMAWLAPEVTGLGIGVVDTIVKDLRYPRVYRRRRAGDDKRTDQREQLLGWSTDMRTKPLMEQTFGQALKEETHGLRDVVTARQFTTYVSDERGRHGAQSGTHDDLVMAYMGALRVASELAPRRDRPVSSRRRRTLRDDITGY